MKLNKSVSANRLKLHRETLLDLSSLRRVAGDSVQETINSCNCATSTVHPGCTIVKPTTTALCN
jgi:hypothetical protein